MGPFYLEFPPGSGEGVGLLKCLCVVILMLAIFSGCQSKSVLVKPALEEEGELVVYLRPLPQESESLVFILDGISAEKEEGGSYPLSLSLKEVRGEKPQRQRFLASSDLSPGKYAGLSFKIKNAAIKGEEGLSVLLVPEQSVTIAFPFQVVKRKALLLSLALDYRKSVEGGYRFSPSFSIFVPDRPPVGLLGYAANTGSNNITVFDKKEGQVVGVIATGRGPRGIALNPRLRRAYVTLAEDDTIEVVDADAWDVVNRLRLQTGDHPRESALSRDGSTLFTVNSGSDSVSVVDTSSLVEVNRIPVGQGPQSILMDREGKRAYVFNARSSTISVIDVASRALAATITTQPGPLRGQFNRNGERLYVIHEFSPYMTMFDPSSPSVQRKIFVGTGMTAIKVDEKTDLIYVGRKPDALEILDPFSLFPVETVPVGGEISHMAIDGDENNLFLVLPDRKVLSILGLIGRKMAPEIDVGEGPCWVTLMGER
jgi:YVTN family beta-propeller protein